MLRRILRLTGVSLLALLMMMLVQSWQSLGTRAVGGRAQRIAASPQWHGHVFENPQPLRNDFAGVLGAMTSASKFTAPAGPVPVAENSAEQLRTPPVSGLRVTWLGHSTTLVEIDGCRVLTDPIFSERASPIGWLGPKRWYAPPVAIDQLPAIDAVVISHDHYDHLDRKTVQALNNGRTVFVVPLGVGAHLAYWGIAETQIVELDWWAETTVGKENALRIVMTPARHASGRMLIDNNTKLWAGYALIGKNHRVYYSGDTGLFNAMKEIGKRFGPFDLTMIETGQYNRSWPDWHIGPEQAVKAHLWVRGKVMLPVHWGLFVLAMHSWTEPIERTSREARRLKVMLATPRPGQSFEPGITPLARWWPQVEWQTAAEHPIQSTQIDQN